MKKENNAGYSLIEVLAAILLLGILSVPLCNSLVMGHKMNVKSQTLLQEQLAVSAAVEQLMSEGIRTDVAEYKDYCDGIDPDLEIEVVQEPDKPYYKVKVTCGDVSVDTVIRMTVPAPTEPSGEGGDAS